MPRGAAVTAKTHPLRERIDEALLSGMHYRAVSNAEWLKPKLSTTSIFNYWKKVIQPRLGANTNIVKALRDGGLLNGTASVHAVGTALQSVTQAQLAADPYISRMAQQDSERLRIKGLAEAKEDYRTWAALDKNDLSATELHARLTGRLDSSAGTTTNNVMVFMPSGQIPTAEVIDVQPIEPAE